MAELKSYNYWVSDTSGGASARGGITHWTLHKCKSKSQNHTLGIGLRIFTDIDGVPIWTKTWTSQKYKFGPPPEWRKTDVRTSL